MHERNTFVSSTSSGIHACIGTAGHRSATASTVSLPVPCTYACPRYAVRCGRAFRNELRRASAAEDSAHAATRKLLPFTPVQCSECVWKVLFSGRRRAAASADDGLGGLSPCAIRCMTHPDALGRCTELKVLTFSPSWMLMCGG